jgi:hypothetical protein
MKSAIIIVGAILVLAGLIGLTYPVFTTSHTEDVAKLGSLKLQNQEQTEHWIPPAASGGVLVLGAVLIAAGVVIRR